MKKVNYFLLTLLYSITSFLNVQVSASNLLKSGHIAAVQYVEEMPTQIILDFAQKIAFHQQESDCTTKTHILFNDVDLKSMHDAQIIKKIKKIKLVKDVAITAQEKNVLLIITFRCGVMVKLSKAITRTRSHRVVIDIYPKTLLQELVKNRRGICLASCGIPKDKKYLNEKRFLQLYL